MKRTKLSKWVALAILPAGVVLGGTAYSAAGGEATSPSAVNQDKARSKEAREDRSRTDRQAVQKGDSYWASDLIGKNVAITGGGNGEIKDLIVNSQTGEVRHAVTEIDTDKAKDRLYAVPLRMFQAGADNKLSLNVDRNWLAQRKSWTGDKWPGMRDQAYWSDDRPSRAGDTATPAAPAGKEPTAAPGARDQPARTTSPAAGNGNAHRVSKLIGQDVENAQGKEVGEIKDIVVNLKSQKAEFVLFGYDPGITKAEKEYAVPLTAFRFPATSADGADEGKRRVVFNMSEDKIKGMKPLESADKNRINDPNFMSRFRGNY